jgi:hypothetical protein
MNPSLARSACFGVLMLALSGLAVRAAEVCIYAPYTTEAGEVTALGRQLAKVLPAFPSLAQSLKTRAPALCIDDSLYEEQGFFEPKANRIVLRAGLDPDMQLAILLHELRHLEQYARGDCPTIALTLSDYMRLRLALEADAAAVGVYAAWKLQQSGIPGPLEQLQSWPTHDDIVTRFKAEIEATGDEVAATSAAFAQWFESDDRRGIYAFAICSNYLDALDTGKMPPGKQTVADDIATRLCVLPDGQAYGCSLPP